jgi:hypothetical protein
VAVTAGKDSYQTIVVSNTEAERCATACFNVNSKIINTKVVAKAIMNTMTMAIALQLPNRQMINNFLSVQ